MKKLVLVLFLGFLVVSSPSQAGAREDSVDGSLISDPALHDYIEASRTPGFSPITDRVDHDGNPVRQ